MGGRRRTEFPVLIIGGGLVGLSTAMFLAQHGVASLAIEKLRGGSPLPRAAHFHLRTLELFRLAGIEDEVNRRRSEEDFLPEGAIIAMDSLSGKKLADIIGSLNAGVEDVSPCRRLFITPAEPRADPAQARAPGGGAQVLEGTKSSAIAQDADGVTVTVAMSTAATSNTLRAQLSRRRRRRAQQGARTARHSVRRSRRLFQQHHDLLHGRLVAAAGRQAAERHLHQQSEVRRLLAARQGLPVGLHGREHGRRSEDQSERAPMRRRTTSARQRLIEFVRAAPACPT